MNIFKTYNLYKEIQNTPTQPTITTSVCYESYTLETKDHNICTEAHYPDYSGENPTKYSVTVNDKKSKKIMLKVNGYKAWILFNQMRNKADQK